MPNLVNRVELALADFDRNQLPASQRTLEGDAFRKAVQAHFEREYAQAGGAIEIVVTDTLITIRWTKNDLKPDLVQAGIACLKKGDLKQGASMLRLARKSHSDNFDVLFNLGMTLSDLGELDEAVDCLEQATRVSPANAHAWTALGVAYARCRKQEAARPALEQAVRLAPNDPHSLKNLGGLLLREAGEERRALECLSKAAVLLPQDAGVWYGCAQAHEALGELASADVAYQRVIQLSPEGPMADDAKAGRGRIAEQNFHAGSGRKLRMDAVLFCADALKRFSTMSPKEIERVAAEIAILGSRGLDVSNPAKRYSIRALPGDYSGLHLLCIEYVGFKLTRPEIDLQFDLSAEYAAAKNMAV